MSYMDLLGMTLGNIPKIPIEFKFLAVRGWGSGPMPTLDQIICTKYADALHTDWAM